MIYRNTFTRAGALLLVLVAAGCAIGKPQASADLSAGLEVAAALESAYAARPGANPKTVTDMARLLQVAQAAITSWENSTTTADRAAADAAIAALVAYEASAGVAS